VATFDFFATSRGHGILDWELGGGFAEAGVGDARFAAMADALASHDARKRALLYHGYAAQRGQ
jgi:hypothetical protein